MKISRRMRGLLPRCWSDLETDAERKEWFEERWTPEPNTGCWLWLQRADKKGYGVAFFGKYRGGALAHRVAYELYVGPIPDGMFLCHTCDTPLCINPAHMFVGSGRDNSLDMMQKGRKHKVTAEQFTKKLNEELVAEIRRRASDGVNHHQLARDFNISRTNIRSIVHRRSWKHVA